MRRSRILPAAPNYAALDAAALVQMSSAEEASAAIKHLSGKVPDSLGPKMVIRYAEPKAGAGENKTAPSDNLYIKGLPLGTPDFLLRAVFVQFGTVVRLKVLEPRGIEAQDCAALVQMSTTPEAEAAVEALHGRVLAAPMPAMRIRYAGKEQEPSSNLYIAGLPSTVHEQQLRTTFGQCGNIMRLRLLTDAGRPETHALVQMSSADEAAKVIETLHGQPPESMGPTLIVRYATDRPKKEEEEEEEAAAAPAATAAKEEAAPPAEE